MTVVFEKTNYARFVNIKKPKKTLIVELDTLLTGSNSFNKIMDLESVGTSNGLRRKKLKVSLEKDLSKRDLSSLPKSVLQRIFSHLDTQSIHNCAVLCSTFYNLSKDSSLYKILNLNYRMSENALEYHISKITHPDTVEIEYDSDQSQDDDLTFFNHSIVKVLRNCGEDIFSLKLDNCKEEEVLTNIDNCVNLERLILHSCKSTFSSLLSLCKLRTIKFSSCHFPQKIVKEVIKNNLYLKSLYLSNNINVNPNELCEVMSRQSYDIKDIHINERKRLRARSLKTLSRLTNLRKLSIISEAGFDCNPEDSFELLAAGCSFLEKLCIDNWKEINDANFISALRMFSQLKTLILRRTNITIKTCREAAITLPLLKTLIVVKCQRIKKAQLLLLKKDFEDIDIPLQ
ncbi:unnamed protein product [Psylliodes chrysocephalus]|uniref:F-box domain-containing protein n=1 Tax=Psylliodes chrysocephalus TaxID=3402493 RepID=A0A9P0D4T2_9CUCU|nr:unnamed protein product [Psylliodes chrysocephala]